MLLLKIENRYETSAILEFWVAKVLGWVTVVHTDRPPVHLQGAATKANQRAI